MDKVEEIKEFLRVEFSFDEARIESILNAEFSYWNDNLVNVLKEGDSNILHGVKGFLLRVYK